MPTPTQRPLRTILYGNAALLVLGAVTQVSQTPWHNVIMLTLFMCWIALFIWRMVSASPDEE